MPKFGAYWDMNRCSQQQQKEKKSEILIPIWGKKRICCDLEQI